MEEEELGEEEEEDKKEEEVAEKGTEEKKGLVLRAAREVVEEVEVENQKAGMRWSIVEKEGKVEGDEEETKVEKLEIEEGEGEEEKEMDGKTVKERRK